MLNVFQIGRSHLGLFFVFRFSLFFFLLSRFVKLAVVRKLRSEATAAEVILIELN